MAAKIARFARGYRPGLCHSTHLEPRSEVSKVKRGRCINCWPEQDQATTRMREKGGKSGREKEEKERRRKTKREERENKEKRKKILFGFGSGFQNPILYYFWIFERIFVIGYFKP